MALGERTRRLSLSDSSVCRDFDSGDLAQGPSHFLDIESIKLDNFYNSDKFAIGYAQLQERWTTVDFGKQYHHHRRRLSSGATSGPELELFSFDEVLKKQNKNQPIASKIKDMFTNFTKGPTKLESPKSFNSNVDSTKNQDATEQEHRPRPKSLLIDASRLNLSSLFNSSNQEEQSSGFSSSTTTPSSSDETYVCSGHGPRASLRSLIETFRNHMKITEKPVNSRGIMLNARIAELETELDTYKKLCESKRKAANLLKHQLMEALYEAVWAETGRRRAKRHLESEMQSLEQRLAAAATAVEDSQITWCRRFNEIVAERDELATRLQLARSIWSASLQKRRSSFANLPPEKTEKYARIISDCGTPFYLQNAKDFDLDDSDSGVTNRDDNKTDIGNEFKDSYEIISLERRRKRVVKMSLGGSHSGRSSLSRRRSSGNSRKNCSGDFGGGPEGSPSNHPKDEEYFPDDSDEEEDDSKIQESQSQEHSNRKLCLRLLEENRILRQRLLAISLCDSSMFN